MSFQILKKAKNNSIRRR